MHLREVYVRRCSLVTGAGIDAIAQYCPNVHTLALAYGTSIRANHFHSAVQHLKCIVDLDLWCIMVDDQVLAQIAKHMANLKSRMLSAGGHSGYTTAGLSAVKWQCANLRVLRLGLRECTGWTDRFEQPWLALRPNLEIIRHLYY